MCGNCFCCIWLFLLLEDVRNYFLLILPHILFSLSDYFYYFYHHRQIIIFIYNYSYYSYLLLFDTPLCYLELFFFTFTILVVLPRYYSYSSSINRSACVLKGIHYAFIFNQVFRIHLAVLHPGIPGRLFWRLQAA